jgi:transcriptional regulator with XRE-family HTH domain
VTAFGDLLRSHRQAASLSQEELAVKAELSTRAIGNMERGLTTRPYPRTLRLLASALGLDDAAASDLISAATPEAIAGPRGESVKMVRFVARAVAAGGLDARKLASDARIPDWVLSGAEAMIPSHYSLRLWELAEHAFDDPQLPLTMAAHVQPGELDLYDYLFATAPTLRDGFELSRQYLRLVTTNALLEFEEETDREVTYSYRYVDAEGRGAELALQFCAAFFCGKAIAGTGQPVAPSRVAFTQSAPRSHRTIGESFGTSTVDFGAPVTTFTFRSQDLDLPMPAADPVLARILTRYADTLAPPRLAG